MSALMAIFPIFSANNFPVRMRVALGALTSFLIVPSMPPFSVEGLGLLQIFMIMLSEGLAGLVIGFVSRMMFHLLDIAGNMIAMQVGLNMAADVNPFSGVRNEVTGTILFYLGAMLFLNLDMHHYLLVALQQGYDILPVGGATMSQALMVNLFQHVSRIFLVATQLAAPMIAVAFIVMLVFSLIGRAVQQINSFFESFAVRVMAGLAIFGLTINLMSKHIINYLRRLPDDVMFVTHIMAG